MSHRMSPRTREGCKALAQHTRNVFDGPCCPHSLTKQDARQHQEEGEVFDPFDLDGRMHRQEPTGLRVSQLVDDARHESQHPGERGEGRHETDEIAEEGEYCYCDESLICELGRSESLEAVAPGSSTRTRLRVN